MAAIQKAEDQPKEIILSCMKSLLKPKEFACCVVNDFVTSIYRASDIMEIIPYNQILMDTEKLKKIPRLEIEDQKIVVRLLNPVLLPKDISIKLITNHQLTIDEFQKIEPLLIVAYLRKQITSNESLYYSLIQQIKKPTQMLSQLLKDTNDAKILDSCIKLTAAVNDSYDILKINSGTLEIISEKLILTDLTDQLGLIKKTKIVIEPNVPRTINTDKKILLQILQRLIDRAQEKEVVIGISFEAGQNQNIIFTINSTIDQLVNKYINLLGGEFRLEGETYIFSIPVTISTRLDTFKHIRDQMVFYLDPHEKRRLDITNRLKSWGMKAVPQSTMADVLTSMSFKPQLLIFHEDICSDQEKINDFILSVKVYDAVVVLVSSGMKPSGCDIVVNEENILPVVVEWFNSSS